MSLKQELMKRADPVPIISTAHIPLYAMRWLEGIEENKSNGQKHARVFSFDTMEYGWIFYAPAWEKDCYPAEEVPKELLDLMEALTKEGFFYVILDGDAPTVDGLPTYDW